MSRPAIPKLSLAFKQPSSPATTSTVSSSSTSSSPRLASHASSPASCSSRVSSTHHNDLNTHPTPSSSSSSSSSSPIASSRTAISARPGMTLAIPKLTLPGRSTPNGTDASSSSSSSSHAVVPSSSSSQQPPPPPETTPTPNPHSDAPPPSSSIAGDGTDGGGGGGARREGEEGKHIVAQQQQPRNGEKAAHGVYLLVPGLAFPRPPPGDPPLTVGQLKAHCRQVFAPARPSGGAARGNATDASEGAEGQLEFFRLSALDRLTDDTVPAPPGLVLAGARLLQQDLTLELVEKMVEENRGLQERVELSGEALIALEERAKRDARTISLLRESLGALTVQLRDLQQKHDTLLRATAATALSPTSGSLSMSVPASPRSTSPHSTNTAQIPHALSSAPSAYHSSFTSLTSSTSSVSTRTATPSRASFSPRSIDLFSPATSPRRITVRHACRSEGCTCTAFSAQPAATWICVCGHMSLKHAA